MKSLKTVAKYLVLTYMLYVVSAILVNSVFSILWKTAQLEKYIWSRVVIYIIVLCAVIMIKNKKNISFNGQKLSVTRKEIFDLGTTLILAIGFCMFNRWMYVIPFFASSLEKIPNGLTIEMVNLLNHSIGWFLLTCIFIPVCEEMLFRGVILNDLLKQYNATKAIVFCTAIFAIFHSSTALFVFPAFYIIGYFYYTKKNIFYPIIFHISHNSFAFLLGNFMENMTKIDYVKMGILGTVIIILGLFMMCRRKDSLNKANQ